MASYTIFVSNCPNGVKVSRRPSRMLEDAPLAHSTRHDVPAQTYYEHVRNTRLRAVLNARNAAAYFTGGREAFVAWVEAAATYHDLGKLDAANQDILSRDSRNSLPIAHEDAGVAALRKIGQNESAVLVAAHHSGLFSKRDESKPNKVHPFRNEGQTFSKYDCAVCEHVDAHLDQYLSTHLNAGLELVSEKNSEPLHRCGFTRRLALSCLVDADHGDTARHYGKEVPYVEIKGRWRERLSALERYVACLPSGCTERERSRNRMRKRLFECCRGASIDPPIRTCEAPVGSGKTTAVMAHLLRVAAARQPELRHIIVILPYTNIINQSVEIYRKALVLAEENTHDVVAEHHHKADFATMESRHLASLWKAPIIVTTAVQFFETLGSHHPAVLRKLHELPGSAVFIDETHAAIPSYLWPQVWRWLETWTRDWGGHLILASGSLPKFWDLDEYQQIILSGTDAQLPKIPDLVEDPLIQQELEEAEKKRIRYCRISQNEQPRSLDCPGLIEFVQRKPGPRLLIVNTVHSAASIAQMMKKSGLDVLHLSAALAPIHRDSVVEKIKLKLSQPDADWTLVATSCIEAGMDFSFRVGFRERSSMASLIQTGGRVSRGDEFEDPEVWDSLLLDDQFRQNRSLLTSRLALERISLEELNHLNPSELATMAMKLEWTCGAEERAREIIEYEQSMEYPSVGKKCRVIEADTRTVIIDQTLAHALRRGEKVPRVELIRHSVQIWADKIEKLALQPITKNRSHTKTRDDDIYVWEYDYDPEFLGYMSGVMKLDAFISAGGAII
jgi:CRISPR-associated endonuclease/helicase Cas3